MSFWFMVCLFGLIAMVPFNFLSVEHLRLQRKYGEKGLKIAEVLGLISGWGLFAFWIGVWVSPSPDSPYR
ncbi:hypothetical protein H5T51_02480 [Candidatus Bathyarchaeota archaeon]|nr:hypothetical protein [Candidatus Bathyarchaeota archaeon]